MSASDVQRLFLQAIMSRQCMSQALARALCKNAVQAVNSVNEDLGLQYSVGYYDNLVGDVNRALEPLSLEFRQMMSEDDGRPICAIINTKGDEVAQMATRYTATEIAYFKLIIEQIMLAPSESFCISSMAALREVGNLPTKALSKSQAQTLLASFVANGWLVLSPNGRYTLSSRAVMELQPYLKSTYEEEVLECTSCLEIVTKGISCYTPNCKCRLHKHCYKLLLNRNQTCPACSADWSPNARAVKKVGEEAAGRDDAPRAARNRRRGGTAPDSDEEQEGEEPDADEDEEEVAAPRPSQAKGKGKAKASAAAKGKGKSKRVVEDDEEEDEEEAMAVDDDAEEEEVDEDVKPRRRSKR